MIKPATIAYVPPPDFGCAKTFLENVRQFQTKYPLILCSDYDYGDGVIKLRERPEIALHSNVWAINNHIFLGCLRMAIANEVSHLLYLESDCRVNGDYWDEAIFDGHFDRPIPAPFTGTIVCYNPCNGGMESARRWSALSDAVRAIGDGIVPATYGSKSAADPSGAAVFLNGALGVYSTDWLARLFRLADTRVLNEAQTSPAWDMAIGLRLWEMMGVNAYDCFGWNRAVYSSYGDVMTTVAERMAMLTSGKVRAIHQVKGSEKP